MRKDSLQNDSDKHQTEILETDLSQVNQKSTGTVNAFDSETFSVTAKVVFLAPNSKLISSRSKLSPIGTTSASTTKWNVCCPLIVYETLFLNSCVLRQRAQL